MPTEELKGGPEIKIERDIIELFHTFLCNSQNYHPRDAVDDPMHCCQRPEVWNSCFITQLKTNKG